MVRKDIASFIKSIPEDVTIVAATKYVDVDDMMILLNNGIINFGENRVNTFLDKYQKLQNEKDIIWHFIGHLQSNKAKDVVDKIDYLHSLDSLRLAAKIEEYRSTPLSCFIEVSINLEENKNGVPYYEVESFINELKKYPKVHTVGLMMMAIQGSENPYEEFNKLTILRDELEKKCQITLPYLSMGMSDDYIDAIKAKATHIRLGRILFSE